VKYYVAVIYYARTPRLAMGWSNLICLHPYQQAVEWGDKPVGFELPANSQEILRQFLASPCVYV